MINGKKYDWEDVSIMLPSGLAVGVQEISYSDEKGIETLYGRGSTPRGYTRKNYSASGSLVLDRDEFERFKLAMGGSPYTARPVPIVVNYADYDLPPIADILPNCKFTKVETSAKQDDAGTGQMKLEFTILEPIKWGGMPAY
ncbi:MAG: hypothetical protein LBJ14_07920 [Desulfarculales bacterium]|jgi:hypothetical protein|nr:hypothetical protein [Desulfarculales bacterium]